MGVGGSTSETAVCPFIGLFTYERYVSNDGLITCPGGQVHTALKRRLSRGKHPHSCCKQTVQTHQPYRTLLGGCVNSEDSLVRKHTDTCWIVRRLLSFFSFRPLWLAAERLLHCSCIKNENEANPKKSWKKVIAYRTVSSTVLSVFVTTHHCVE